MNDATGKLDRKKLPKPSTETADGPGSESKTAPAERDAVDNKLAELWAKCLRCDASSLSDKVSFYEAGGHSLLMARLASLVASEFEIPFVVSDVANNSTFGQMGRAIRRLLSPEETKSSDEEAPVDDTEASLATVWARLLRCAPSSLGPGDRFFEVGGHSLLLSRLCNVIQQQYGISFTISDITANPSLTAMAKVIKDRCGETAPAIVEKVSAEVGTAGAGKGHGVTSTMLENDATLDPSIYPAATRKNGYSRFRPQDASRPPARVLLTGVTGYLGAHLLYSLLANTHVDVYCLVRASTPEDAFDRILETLTAYDLWVKSDEENKEDTEAANSGAVIRPMPLDAHSVGWTGDEHEETLSPDVENVPPRFRKHQQPKGTDRADEWLHRIIPVCGDLSRPALGLSHDNFRHLAGQVDAIIHNGAEVNLVKSYGDLRNTNVLGTQEVLRLAVTNGVFDWNATKVKPVHFISTNGVFTTER